MIAVDMDDVITDTVQQGLDWYERNFGEKHSKEVLTGGYMGEFIPENRRDIVRNYFYTPGFFRNVKPLPGAIDGLRWLHEHFEVFVVTAAQQFPQSLNEKNEWLDEFAPFIPWTHRVFCGAKYFVGTDYMIDDHAYNFEFYSGTPLLFTSPHNAEETGYERVDNWEDVIRYFSPLIHEMESE